MTKTLFFRPAEELGLPGRKISFRNLKRKGAKAIGFCLPTELNYFTYFLYVGVVRSAVRRWEADPLGQFPTSQVSPVIECVYFMRHEMGVLLAAIISKSKTL